MRFVYVGLKLRGRVLAYACLTMDADRPEEFGGGGGGGGRGGGANHARSWSGGLPLRVITNDLPGLGISVRPTSKRVRHVPV